MLSEYGRSATTRMKKIFKTKRTFIEPAKRFLSSAASSKLQNKEHQAIGSPVHRVNLPDFKASATCHYPAMDIGPSMRSKSAKRSSKSKCGKKLTGEMRDLVSSVVDEVLFFKPTPAVDTALNKNFKQISNSDIIVLDCRETVKKGDEVLTPTLLSHPQDQKQVSATVDPWETVVESFALVAVEAITLVIDSRKKSGKRLSKENKTPKNSKNALNGIKGNNNINKLKFGYKNFNDNFLMKEDKSKKLLVALESMIKILKEDLDMSEPIRKEPAKVPRVKPALKPSTSLNRLLSLCSGEVVKKPLVNSCTLVDLITRGPIKAYKDAKDIVVQVFGIKPFEFGGLTRNIGGRLSFLITNKALSEYLSRQPYPEAGKIQPWSMSDLDVSGRSRVAMGISSQVTNGNHSNKALKKGAECLLNTLTTGEGDFLDFVNGFRELAGRQDPSCP